MVYIHHALNLGDKVSLYPVFKLWTEKVHIASIIDISGGFFIANIKGVDRWFLYSRYKRQ